MALIAGLVVHSFIIGVNVRDWWRGRSVTPVDHIVTSLGISRIFTQFAVTLVFFLVILFPKSPILQISTDVIDAVYDIMAVNNFCLTSLLSIVLCLNISNLHTTLFLYLRRMISHRTGRLIVASGIYSVLKTFLILLMANTTNCNSATHNTTRDSLSKCIYINSIYNIITGTFFPLLFYLTSSVLLFISLYHHTTRMKMSSNLSINLETYYSTMRFVGFTFLYKTMYFFGNISAFMHYFFYCVTLDWLYLVLEFLPVLHSSYLIYRTAKLRNQMSKVLQNLVDFVLQRKIMETVESVEIVAREVGW
ncbi:hypothetical protein GDO81_025889 [Engystomops pustulosus]|uniref:Taste receptor type 2 n=1 Tax=Engystomops pustulosus TaxID=76066 RepID=A0AAV6ZJ38_ENGPU|nr:hypothetical protein GDO81_025889 [Engystomops pustulosus]